MTAIITTSGLQTSEAALLSILSGQWAIAQGSSDIITAAYPIPNTILSDGLLLGFRALAANTTTTPTFSPDGLPPAVIVRAPTVALVANDIGGAGFEILIRYNLALNLWIMLSHTTA